MTSCTTGRNSGSSISGHTRAIHTAAARISADHTIANASRGSSRNGVNAWVNAGE